MMTVIFSVSTGLFAFVGSLMSIWGIIKKLGARKSGLFWLGQITKHLAINTMFSASQLVFNILDKLLQSWHPNRYYYIIFGKDISCTT